MLQETFSFQRFRYALPERKYRHEGTINIPNSQVMKNEMFFRINFNYQSSCWLTTRERLELKLGFFSDDITHNAEISSLYLILDTCRSIVQDWETLMTFDMIYVISVNDAATSDWSVILPVTVRSRIHARSSYAIFEELHVYFFIHS